MRIVILDYALGNVFSLYVAFRRLSADIEISSDEKVLKNCDAVVLPGVGSFPAAMQRIEPIRWFLEDMKGEKPMLGICLGLQLFFESSVEGGVKTKGLGFIKGEVVELPNTVKKPHMGWNTVVKIADSTLLKDLDNEYFYFAHSYYAQVREDNVVKAVTTYGVKIPSVVEKDSLFGTQFHPEKSGKYGRQVLINFLKFVKR